uniref:Uncharacterized protein n=1 Tax=Ditylenchus dipsaci TaxID=166011 RepID=A0A915CX97_9BILA
MTGKRAEGWNLYASINRSGNLNGLKALDESTCSASSGYGSQDSSPESSVHSPDWQPPSSLSSSTVGDSSTSNILERDRTMDSRNQHMDKQKSGKYEDVNDEHIYHELECLNRLSLLLDDEQNNFNSELVSVAGSSYRLSYESTDQTHPHQDSQRNSSSPIYAVPYEAYRHVPAEIDLTISNNNYTGHYRHVKPIYRDLHLPSSKSTAQYNHGSNDLPVQQALQISSPFYSSHSPCPEGYRHDPIFASNHHSSAKNGLRTGIIVRAQPSLSDSSSEDEPEEEMMEEGEQSSTSCSSWTAMLISPRAQAQHRPCHFNAPPPPPLQQSMRARPNEFDFLAELDQQIVELQHQSDAVRHLVEQAKERHELRSKTRQLCMEHLKELRKMRWFMHNNFELCL